jgi:hypothetical protein
MGTPFSSGTVVESPYSKSTVFLSYNSLYDDGIEYADIRQE